MKRSFVAIALVVVTAFGLGACSKAEKAAEQSQATPAASAESRPSDVQSGDSANPNGMDFDKMSPSCATVFQTMGDGTQFANIDSSTPDGVQQYLDILYGTAANLGDIIPGMNDTAVADATEKLRAAMVVYTDGLKKLRLDGDQSYSSQFEQDNQNYMTALEGFLKVCPAE